MACILAHWWVLLVALVLAVLAGAGYRQQQARWEAVRAQGLRYGLEQLDALHHAKFEEAIRDLMRRDGCRDAQRVGGGSDLGADVKATDPARAALGHPVQAPPPRRPRFGGGHAGSAGAQRNGPAGARGGRRGARDERVGDRASRGLRQAAAAACSGPPDAGCVGVGLTAAVGAAAGRPTPEAANVVELSAQRLACLGGPLARCQPSRSRATLTL